MKLISMKCPQCNGELRVSEDAKQAVCPFCRSAVMIDDGVQHVQFDNSEQLGYDFETGRMKAQEDFAQRQEERRQEAVRVQQQAAKKKKQLVWWIIGWVLCFPIPLTILIVKTKKLKKGIKIALIAALWGVLAVMGAIGAAIENAKPTWAEKEAPLTDFVYTMHLDTKELTLESYKGGDKQVRIASSYEIDGKSYAVTALEGTFFLKKVESVIVPEGVTRISGTTFDNSLKYLYLPSTLTDFNCGIRFKNGKKLYYGGTEEQWNKLYPGSRDDLDFKQIIFNAKIEDLPRKEK